jgi:hypothetical protein
VAVQAVALVLGEHRDPEHPGVDEVRQREVDQPIQPAERDGRLGPVQGQRREALALTAGEHDTEHLGI